MAALVAAMRHILDGTGNRAGVAASNHDGGATDPGNNKTIAELPLGGMTPPGINGRTGPEAGYVPGFGFFAGALDFLVRDRCGRYGAEVGARLGPGYSWGNSSTSGASHGGAGSESDRGEARGSSERQSGSYVDSREHMEAMVHFALST